MARNGMLDEPDDGLDEDQDEDVLELGGRHAGWFVRLMSPATHQPSRLAVAAMLAAAALAVAAALVKVASDSPPRQPVAARHVQPDIARVSMATVRSLADRHHVLRSYVRQTSHLGACAIVTVGQLPRRHVYALMRADFPGYRLTDSAEVLDQFTGLCSIEIRASRSNDATVIVRVASPPTKTRPSAYTRFETGIETRGRTTTKYAVAVTETGWRVLVGATGSTAFLPSADVLARLAQDPTLVW